jgi:integrase
MRPYSPVLVSKVCQLLRLRRSGLYAKEPLRAGGAYQDHDLIFPSTIGTPTTRNTIDARHLKPILSSASLLAISPHDLRHTCATLLLAQNVNVKYVQTLLGHATASITLDTYSHILPSMADATAVAMERVLAGDARAGVSMGEQAAAAMDAALLAP